MRHCALFIFGFLLTASGFAAPTAQDCPNLLVPEERAQFLTAIVADIQKRLTERDFHLSNGFVRKRFSGRNLSGLGINMKTVKDRKKDLARSGSRFRLKVNGPHLDLFAFLHEEEVGALRLHSDRPFLLAADDMSYNSTELALWDDVFGQLENAGVRVPLARDPRCRIVIRGEPLQHLEHTHYPYNQGRFFAYVFQIFDAVPAQVWPFFYVVSLTESEMNTDDHWVFRDPTSGRVFYGHPLFALYTGTDPLAPRRPSRY